MVDSILLFEDNYSQQLLPLVYFRPVYDLRCGILTLREKVKIQYADINLMLHCRPYLTHTLKENNSGISINQIDAHSSKCMFINGRVIVDDNFVKNIDTDGDDAVYTNGDCVIAAVLSGDSLKKYHNSLPSVFELKDFEEFKKINTNITPLNYPWNFISANASQIENDFSKLVDKNSEMIKGNIYEGVNFVNKKNVFIDEGAKIKPGVVLDAEDGPIYIGKKAKIFPNAVIEGPCFIGNNSQIKVGAKIYEGTSIGEVCKVGGEVEESIIHSYSNKQHDGFLGHAYLGCWVNLGADTNNSDLKNNYGNVKVLINGEQIDSGSMFVGLTMGDHSKSAINSMFNTGTVVGVSSNVFGSGFPPKYIPSFSWGGAEDLTTYALDKSINVAARVMARRDLEFTETDKQLFTHVFEMTSGERIKR